MTRIRIKRVYEPEAPEDGYRVLVDKLWPRGIRKEALRYDLWAKEIAPTPGLRTWFHAAPRGAVGGIPPQVYRGTALLAGRARLRPPDRPVRVRLRCCMLRRVRPETMR